MNQFFKTATDVTSYQDAFALDMQGNYGESNQRANSPTNFLAVFVKKKKLKIGCVSSGALWM
jgi:hypothetical protein